MSKPLCVYHANCNDGYGAATVVRKFFNGDVDLHAAQYGDPIPDVHERQIVIVDFSYPLAELESLAHHNHVLVLDHHKTAAKDLEGLLTVGSWTEFHLLTHRLEGFALRAVFDMERSGAGLTWDFFFPGVMRPKLIDFVEDRDLWRFKYPNSRPVHSYLSSYSFTPELWSSRLETFDDLKACHQMIGEGIAIDRAHLKRIEEFLAENTSSIRLIGLNVPSANVPFAWASDAGNMLAKGREFAATWCETNTTRAFSLRSMPGGLDVSAIAKFYGGGGHPHAAGFKMPKGWSGDPRLIEDLVTKFSPTTAP